MGWQRLTGPWRRRYAVAPVGVTAATLLWAFAAWWIVPAFHQSAGSIIQRIVLGAHVPLVVVQAVVVTLVLLGCITVIRDCARTAWLYGVLSFSWWLFVWLLSVKAQPTSTSTGSYGVVVALAVLYLDGLRRVPVPSIRGRS